MATLDPLVLDNLNWLTNTITVGAGKTIRVDMCTSEPTTITEATTTFSVGNAPAVTCTIGNRTPRGREVTIPQITGASATGNGTPTHWAITDGTNLLVVHTVASSDAFTTGGTWGTNAAWTVGYPGVA